MENPVGKHMQGFQFLKECNCEVYRIFEISTPSVATWRYQLHDRYDWVQGLYLCDATQNWNLMIS